MSCINYSIYHEPNTTETSLNQHNPLDDVVILLSKQRNPLGVFSNLQICKFPDEPRWVPKEYQKGNTLEK